MIPIGFFISSKKGLGIEDWEGERERESEERRRTKEDEG